MSKFQWDRKLMKWNVGAQLAFPFSQRCYLYSGLPISSDIALIDIAS